MTIKFNYENRATGEKGKLTLKDAVELIRQRAVDKLGDIAADVDATAMAQEVMRELNNRRKAIMLQFMGIDTSFSDVRLDAGPLRAALALELNPLLEKWKTEFWTEWQSDPALMAEVKRVARTAFMKNLADTLQNRVRDDAYKIARDLLAHVSQQIMTEMREELKKELEQ